MKATGGTTIFQISEITAAVAFYRDILGFAEDFRYPGYAWTGSALHLRARTISAADF